MKQLVTAVLLLALLAPSTGCKKYIEKKQEEAAVQIITSGRWKMNAFSTGTANQVGQFDGYLFQFNTDATVDAYYNGTLQQSGGWTYDIPNRTVTGNFSTTAAPLALINGTWTITSSTETSVDAERTVNGEVRRMHMDKQ